MSSAADRTRAKAARLAQAGQHHTTEDQEAAPPVSHVPMPVSAKPIRISLDLVPVLLTNLPNGGHELPGSWGGKE